MGPGDEERDISGTDPVDGVSAESVGEGDRVDSVGRRIDGILEIRPENFGLIVRPEGKPFDVDIVGDPGQEMVEFGFEDLAGDEPQLHATIIRSAAGHGLGFFCDPCPERAVWGVYGQHRGKIG